MGAHPEQLLHCWALLLPAFSAEQKLWIPAEAPVGALLTPDLPSCHLQHLFVTPGEPGRDGLWCGRFGGAGLGFTTGCELS